MATHEQLTPGTAIPQLIFIGLKGRTAFFRLPITRVSRDPNVRVFCRLVDLFKTARAFIKSPPELGTIFKDAVVIDSAAPPKTSLVIPPVRGFFHGYVLCVDSNMLLLLIYLPVVLIFLLQPTRNWRLVT